MSVTTKKKKIENTDLISRIRRGCGEVWTRTLKAKQWLFYEHDYELNKLFADALFAAQGLTKNVRRAMDEVPAIRALLVRSRSDALEEGWSGLPPLRDAVDRKAFSSNPFTTDLMLQAPSQQRQQTNRRLFDAFQTYYTNHANNPDHNPPGRKWYYNPRWVRETGSKIKKVDENTLRLGTSRGQDSIVLDWPHPRPVTVEIGWDGKQPVAVAVYDTEEQDLSEDLIRTREAKGKKVAGIDLGEIFLATAHDGEESVLVDGSKLRELRQLQNEEKRWFQKRIDRKQKGSNRWWKLVRAKNDRLDEIRNRIDDLLHKLSTRLVEELWHRGVGTIVFGDITGIRENIDYGADMNRRLHQWAFREFADKMTYKAERYGMTVSSEDEAHTSSTCPSCGAEVNPDGRDFRCSDCGFEAHRDVVGAVAIRALHLHDADEEDQDRDPRSRILEAVRATATGGSKSPTGSPSGRKTPRQRDASAPKRATHSVHFSISYEPHMDCVLAPSSDNLTEG
jgi:putative transposase